MGFTLETPGVTSRATLARGHWRRLGFPLPGGTSRATLARRHWRRLGFHPSKTINSIAAIRTFLAWGWFSKPSIPLQLYALFGDSLSVPNRFAIIYSILRLFSNNFPKNHQNAITNTLFGHPLSGPHRFATIYNILRLFFRNFPKNHQNAINNSISTPLSKPKFWSFTFFFFFVMF